MMMLLSSLKSQCVERKKRVDALRIEMAQFVEQHRAAWNRADVWGKFLGSFLLLLCCSLL